MHIAHLVELAQLKIKDMALVQRIALPTHKEVKQCVEDVGLQQRHNQEAPVVGRVQDAELLGQVLVVLLLGLGIGVEADGIEATFVEDDIEGIVRVVELKEVALGICDTRNVALLHLLYALGYEVDRRDIGLIHACAELL